MTPDPRQAAAREPKLWCKLCEKTVAYRDVRHHECGGEIDRIRPLAEAMADIRARLGTAGAPSEEASDRWDEAWRAAAWPADGVPNEERLKRFIAVLMPSAAAQAQEVAVLKDELERMRGHSLDDQQEVARWKEEYQAALQTIGHWTGLADAWKADVGQLTNELAALRQQLAETERFCQAQGAQIVGEEKLQRQLAEAREAARFETLFEAANVAEGLYNGIHSPYEYRGNVAEAIRALAAGGGEA